MESPASWGLPCAKGAGSLPTYTLLAPTPGEQPRALPRLSTLREENNFSLTVAPVGSGDRLI